LGCLSFFPSKNLGGIGDGGMVVTNEPELADKVKLLRGHGAHPKYYHNVIGGNFRLDAIQAAVLRVKLKYLDTWTVGRQQNAQHYRELFAQAGLEDIMLPTELDDCRHIYNQFVVYYSRRDDLMTYLKGKKTGCEVYYPVPMHLQECFADLGYTNGDFSVSEDAAQKTLAVPIYPELCTDMLSAVVDSIAIFHRNHHE